MGKQREPFGCPEHDPYRHLDCPECQAVEDAAWEALPCSEPEKEDSTDA